MVPGTKFGRRQRRGKSIFSLRTRRSFPQRLALADLYLVIEGMLKNKVLRVCSKRSRSLCLAPNLGQPPFHPRRSWTRAHVCERWQIQGRSSMKTSGLGTVGRFCLTFMAMLLLACGVFPQSTTDGAIGGTVTDQSGAVVPNAAVSAKNLSTGANANGTSDEGGRFLLIHLQPGVYSLEVSTSGFSAFKATRIIVEVGRTTTVDTTLGVQAQTETITATAEAPVITISLQTSMTWPSTICRSTDADGPHLHSPPPGQFRTGHSDWSASAAYRDC